MLIGLQKYGARTLYQMCLKACFIVIVYLLVSAMFYLFMLASAVGQGYETTIYWMDSVIYWYAVDQGYETVPFTAWAVSLISVLLISVLL